MVPIQATQPEAYRMPLPPDVDDFKVPDFDVLMKLVHNRSVDEAMKLLKGEQSSLNWSMI